MSVGDDPPEPRPRSIEAIIQDFKSVLAASIAGNIQAAGRVRGLLTNSPPARQETAASEPRGAAASGDIVQILDFALASVRLLTEQSLVIVNGILDEAEVRLKERSADSAAAPATNQSAAGGVEILMKGVRGERAGAAFLLENKYDRNVDVTFEVSDLGAEGRPAIPGSLVKVEPEAVTLPPRGQAVIRLEIAVGDIFAPGESYFGTLRTAGFETRHIRIRLDVEAEAPIYAASPAAAPKLPRRRQPSAPAL